jgi:alginate O-acetyltransferase complex protein AlgI
MAHGFFLKVVVANSVAQIADIAFRANQTHGWLVIIGTFAFAIQIYTDFLAYCLIARGTARLLGFHVRWNFDLPYFSTSLQDFWRRWNISLSEWLRDYLYVPLGGNRRGRTRTYLNLLATMVLGGLWHGAAWNFIAWGVLHGSVLCIERLGRGKLQWRPPSVLGWATTMAVVMFGWFLFRCDSWEMVVGMGSALSNMTWKSEFADYLLTMSVLVAPIFLHEALQYRSGDPLVALRLDQWSLGLVVGLMIAMTVVAFGRFDAAFIYFQF